MELTAARPAPRPHPPAAPVTHPNATLIAREDISPTVVRLRVRPDDGVPSFSPGQYFALGLTANGRFVQRPSSTASPSGESDALEFLVRLVPGGALTPALWGLGAGARLRVGRPKGLFIDDTRDSRRPVYAATGTGIAPLVSMLETRLRERPDGSAAMRPVVIHGAAHARDLGYRARLEELASDGRVTYVAAVSRPADACNAGWTSAVGRIDGLLPAVLHEAGVDPGASIAFVCGNPAMAEAVTGVLTSLGMTPDSVRTEAYWLPTASA